jgi:hypothetical protein
MGVEGTQTSVEGKKQAAKKVSGRCIALLMIVDSAKAPNNTLRS